MKTLNSIVEDLSSGLLNEMAMSQLQDKDVLKKMSNKDYAGAVTLYIEKGGAVGAGAAPICADNRCPEPHAAAPDRCRAWHTRRVARGPDGAGGHAGAELRGLHPPRWRVLQGHPGQRKLRTAGRR